MLKGTAGMLPAKSSHCTINNQKEIWRSAKGYENLYEVSNLGNVRNSRTGRVLKPLKLKTNNGYYLQVCLYKDKKATRLYIHRLVAEAFIPNSENLPEVNHIDENKNNNNVNNLEWVSPSYNKWWSCARREQNNQKEISNDSVSMTDKQGFTITFKSLYEATIFISQKLEIDRLNAYRNINRCLKGCGKTAYKCTWKYAN